MPQFVCGHLMKPPFEHKRKNDHSLGITITFVKRTTFCNNDAEPTYYCTSYMCIYIYVCTPQKGVYIQTGQEREL